MAEKVSNVGQWERGEKTPSTAHLSALAKLVDVSVSWLLDEGIAEHPRSYERGQQSGPAAVLADYLAPPGLRELTSTRDLVTALHIQPAEWEALRPLQTLTMLSVIGKV